MPLAVVPRQVGFRTSQRALSSWFGAPSYLGADHPPATPQRRVVGVPPAQGWSKCPPQRRPLLVGSESRASTRRSRCGRGGILSPRRGWWLGALSALRSRSSSLMPIHSRLFRGVDQRPLPQRFTYHVIDYAPLTKMARSVWPFQNTRSLLPS